MRDMLDFVSCLRCPSTGLELRLLQREDAERECGEELYPLRLATASESDRAPVTGVTDEVLLRSDGNLAYPVVDGMPILLAPEALGRKSDQREFDLGAPYFAEAYAEMRFYNRVASEEAEKVTESGSYEQLGFLRKQLEHREGVFPVPREAWLDAIYDCAAQWDAYTHLSPIDGGRLMQLGGRGFHAVKFLLGGAAEAFLVTPMLGEARFALALAKAIGVAEGLRCVVAVAEQLPLRDDLFDGIYSGGCLHHMVTDAAVPESSRVLKPGGRFAAADPWKTPFHVFGTKLFGKREAVHCRPLTPQRVAPVSEVFEDGRVVLHGSLTRHPLLALNKLGVSSSLRTAWNLNAVDDWVSSRVPGLRRLGSSAVVLATKGKGSPEEAHAA